jgi:hypothetical protein
VTSVPFVAHINEAASEDTARWKEQLGTGNPANDKWSAPRFRRQREQIIEHIATNNIEQVVFLTGDMHCCYHATMQIGSGSKYECTTIHELAGGPVNQLQLANIDEFNPLARGITRGANPQAYEVVLDRFHSEVNAVLHITVKFVEREPVLVGDCDVAPVVEWNVVRTLTDNDAAAWRHDSKTETTPAEETTPAAETTPATETISATETTPPKRRIETAMYGEISFVKKRAQEDLVPWR